MKKRKEKKGKRKGKRQGCTGGTTNMSITSVSTGGTFHDDDGHIPRRQSFGQKQTGIKPTNQDRTTK